MGHKKKKCLKTRRKALLREKSANMRQAKQLNNIFKNEEKTKQFFQLVKERDQLWNVNSPLFNDEDIPVWIMLITTLDTELKRNNPDFIEKMAIRFKNQWQKIQDQYHDAMLKEQPYIYEKYLEFVKEIVKTRATEPLEIKIKVEPKEQLEIEIEKDGEDSDVEQAETDALASCSGPPKKKIKIVYDVEEEQESDGDGNEGGDGDPGDTEEEEEDEDEDLAFFASITGQVKTLPEEGKLEFRKEVMKVLRRLKKKYEVADKHKGKQYRQVGKTVNIE